MYEVRTVNASLEVQTRPQAERLAMEFVAECPVNVYKNGIFLFGLNPIPTARGKRHGGKGNKKGKPGRG